VSGAGPENGAERAQKSDKRERDLKKYSEAGAERSGADREREHRIVEWERRGERAESAAHNPLKPNNND